MSINEIAVMLKKGKEEFGLEIKNENSLASQAYHRGKTFSKMELRKNVIKMAKHGSSNAEAMVQKYISKQQIEDKWAK